MRLVSEYKFAVHVQTEPSMKGLIGQLLNFGYKAGGIDYTFNEEYCYLCFNNMQGTYFLKSKSDYIANDYCQIPFDEIGRFVVNAKLINK